MKIFYLLPFILIGLSLTPFALYKDTVKYGSSLDILSPSHWKVRDMQISFFRSFPDTASSEVDLMSRCPTRAC